MGSAELLQNQLSRRRFLRGGAVAALCLPAIITGCTEPVRSPHISTPPRLTPLPTSIPTTPEGIHITPELEQLGQELRQWQLQDGRLMTDLFTEVLLAADLLQGNLDPKTVLPSFK